jgi:cytoskeletal protein RodZ
MNNPFGGPHDMGFGVFGLLGLIVWGFFALLSLAVVVGLIFLLVRFLLIGTRAAQLYLYTNSPLRHTPPGESPTRATAAPTATAPAATAPDSDAPATATAPTVAMPRAAAAAETKPAATKPAAKPRVRRIPPTSDQR